MLCLGEYYNLYQNFPKASLTYSAFWGIVENILYIHKISDAYDEGG